MDLSNAVLAYPHTTRYTSISAGVYSLAPVIQFFPSCPAGLGHQCIWEVFVVDDRNQLGYIPLPEPA